MDRQIDKNTAKTILLLFIGISLRFICMALGHNFDWESYCIVGDIASNFKNVYAETSRYNYGPIFFCIQGLFCGFSKINQTDSELVYRVLMVSLLTFGDLGITYFIAKRFSIEKGLMFFLNPVSIIITGYHNQFDNLAVLLALCTIIFYNEDEKINKQDIKFVLLLALSLITKHIFFLLPIFIFFRPNLNFRKKCFYIVIPVLLFLCSFVPFAFSAGGFKGILNNVFLYRSYNNAPLLSFFYSLISFPNKYKIVVYGLLMVMAAFFSRQEDYYYQVMIYLISMVTFSSAIANQYLVIPMVALCILDVGKLRYFYMLLAAFSLTINADGLHLINMADKFPTVIRSLIIYYDNGRYIIAAWMLAIILLVVFLQKKKV